MSQPEPSDFETQERSDLLSADLQWLSGIPGCDPEEALHKMGETPELIVELLQDFQHSYRDILPKLEHLLLRDSSLSDKHPEGLLRLLYTLKGLIGTSGSAP